MSYRKFDENMIKGRIAEAIIEQLFISSGYDVFRYGMENAVPGITNLLRRDKTDVAKDIRRMPDLVVHNRENKKTFLIEVKYRWNGYFSIKDKSFKDGYLYEECYFVIVSQNLIKCISYNELKNGGKITESDQNYLGKEKEFNFDNNTIIEFVRLSRNIFSGL